MKKLKDAEIVENEWSPIEMTPLTIDLHTTKQI